MGSEPKSSPSDVVDSKTSNSSSKHPSEFTAKDVAEFVRSTFGDGERGTKIRKNFEDHEVDGEILTTLEKDDLTGDLGMTKLQARKFKLALDKLLLDAKKNTEEETAAATATTDGNKKTKKDEAATATDETSKKEKTSDIKKDADGEEKASAAAASAATASTVESTP